MKGKLLFLCVASFAGVRAAGAADTLLAETSAAATFDVHATNGATYVVQSLAEAAAFPPVAWRAGETVTATARNGTVIVLAGSAASDGAAPFSPLTDGIWALENSAQGTALIVIGDYEVPLAASGCRFGYGVDSELPGPNRRLEKFSDALPVSYSGDDWIGDAVKAATLTFTAPNGTVTTLNRTGTGATSFAFDKPGRWRVLLGMEDGTTREAVLNIAMGFVIIFT